MPIVPATPENIALAASLIFAGRLVAFPTETVYGLGANALDAEAVRRIFAAKGRPANNPVIVHIADANQLPMIVGEWPELAGRLAAKFWPGPLTLVLPRHGRVPDEVTGGGVTVAVRWPVHPIAQELIKAAGVPIAAPSANRSSELSPTTAQHVWKSLDTSVDLILDGGSCPAGIESTVLSLAHGMPRLLRPGPIGVKELLEFVPNVILDTFLLEPGPLPSPGMMERHYAPRTPLELAPDDGAARVRELLAANTCVGWVTWPDAAAVDGVLRRELPREPVAYAAKLYDTLHELDDWRPQRIVVARVPDAPGWEAVRDRLSRASQ